MNDDFKSQLTALALDELPAEDRARIDASCPEGSAADAYALETREFCTLLSEALAAPAETALTHDQREALAHQLVQSTPKPEFFALPRVSRRWLAWGAGMGAAAAAVAVSSHWLRESEPPAMAALEMKHGRAPAGERGERGAAAVSDGFAGRQFAASSPEPQASLLADAEAGSGPPDVEAGSGPPDGEAGSGPPDAPALLAMSAAAPEAVLATADAGAPADGIPPFDDGTEALDRGVAQSALGYFDAARTSLNEALSADPGHGLARTELGRVDTMTREYALSARDHTRARMLASADSQWEAAAPGEGPSAVAAQPASAAPPARPGLGQLAAASVPSDESEGTDRLGFAAAPALTDALPASHPADQPRGEVVALAGSSSPQKPQRVRLAKEGEPAGRWHLGEAKLNPLGAGVFDTEAYAEVPENPFVAVGSEPLSTFAIDVDTAGYANVRRFLNQGRRPPRAAVRLEELVNYFPCDYPQPAGDAPFSVTVDLAGCPWQPQHRLARIGLQGRKVAREQRPAANLVFLIDVSGSMAEPAKLPLVKQSLQLLTSQLKGGDHVALVTYAGSSGVALASTSLEHQDVVSRAIESLSAGGSTNGASGIQLAYEQARQHFKKDGVNRVLLATDGDFNVGITDQAALQKLITEEAKSGVFLSVLGYGMGNLKDATMEMLADQGNGNYACIDSLSEARKVLGDQLDGTLMTIAKDVKIQVEFNPTHVRHYRLLGYENRMLAKQDFNDDQKDAGEIGAGHSVTALYEIVPMSAPPIQPPVDPLKYQPAPAAGVFVPVTPAPAAADQPGSTETMTVKLRYKAPDGEASQLLEVPVVDRDATFAEAPADFKFAASVAMTGLLLKDSAYKGDATWNMVRELARAGKGPDAEGYRGEFLQLIEKAAGVAP